jgi:uncharacterized protein (TIRG00374 family)
VTLVFASWCAYALRGDLEQLSLAPVLRSWDLLALAVLLSLLNYLLRIFRWRSYLGRLGHVLTVRFAALSYIAGFAYTLSPGKVGEMVRARYYVPLGVPVSDVAAAFFAERMLDLMGMVVLASLFVTALSRYTAVVVAAGVIVALLLTLVAFVPWSAVLARIRSTHRMPPAVRSMLVGVTSALVSTRPLLRPGPLAVGFIMGLFAWGFEGLGLGVLGSIFPASHLDAGSAVGIYGIAVLIGGVSFLPGGIGSTEAVMTALLVTRGFALSQALLVTLACRLVTLWLGVCLGWLAVLLLRQRSVAVAPWQ